MNDASESAPCPPFESLLFCLVELMTVALEISFSSSSCARIELVSVTPVRLVMIDAVSAPSLLPSEGEENVEADPV